MTQVRQIAGEANESRDKAVDDLFKDMKDESIKVLDLPSRGKFYGKFKGIDVFPLTFSDEQLVLAGKGRRGDPISDLLDKTTKGVAIDNLLAMDKMYLLMKVRELSYGDKYEFSVVCPSCKHDTKASINLSEQLSMNMVPEEETDPRTITLPKLGVEITVRFPRGDEEHYMADMDELYKNVYRFVVDLKGETDPIFIAKAVRKMHIMDVKTIVKEVVKPEYGVDSRFVFKCGNCGDKETMSIPLDSNFFSVS